MDYLNPVQRYMVVDYGKSVNGGILSVKNFIL